MKVFPFAKVYVGCKVLFFCCHAPTREPCYGFWFEHNVMKSRLLAEGFILRKCCNWLWLTQRGVWQAVLLHSRARGDNSSWVKSVHPDPKARASNRRKSIRGTFSRLSLRRRQRRQVLGESAHAQLDQSTASVSLISSAWLKIVASSNASSVLQEMVCVRPSKW